MASQSFFSVPSKVTKSVDFEKVFLRFIASNFDEDTPSRYAEPIREFSNLRESTVVKVPDKHETGLDLITRWVASRYGVLVVSIHGVFLGIMTSWVP